MVWIIVSDYSRSFADSAFVSSPLTAHFPETGDNPIEAVRYVDPQPDSHPGRVYINKTQYFDTVPPETYAFQVGGYQVCNKWLKDRKGRALSYEDITHYQKIVAALTETRRLMSAIDEAISGWLLT